MKLPKQSKPVPRPMLHDPYPTVDLSLLEAELQAIAMGGNPDALKDLRDALLNARFELLHSINHDDPQAFSSPASFGVCHILAGQSRLLCVAECSQF